MTFPITIVVVEGFIAPVDIWLFPAGPVLFSSSVCRRFRVQDYTLMHGTGLKADLRARTHLLLAFVILSSKTRMKFH